MTSRIYLFLIIPVMIVLVCPFVLFANLWLLMCLNVFFDHNIFLSLDLKNSLKTIDVSRTHSLLPHRLPHFVKLPSLNCSLLIRCSLNSLSTTLSNYRFNILSIMFLDFTLWGLNRMMGIVGAYSSILHFGVTKYREWDVDIGVQGDGVVIGVRQPPVNGIQVWLFNHIDRQVVPVHPFTLFITAHSLDELEVCVVASGNR